MRRVISRCRSHLMSAPGRVRRTPIAARSSRTPSRSRETREPPRFWRFRAASARPFRAPCPTNLLSRRKKAEATSDVPLSPRAGAIRAGRQLGDHRAQLPGRDVPRQPRQSRCFLPRVTFRRANADMTLSTIPFSSSPIGVKRNSSNLCSKRNSECISGISITASRRLSGREATLRLRLRLSRLLT